METIPTYCLWLSFAFLIFLYLWFSQFRFLLKAKMILKNNPECKTLKSLIHDTIMGCGEIKDVKNWLKLYREYKKTENMKRATNLQLKLGLS